MTRHVCIHGHFYQPPRESPWLESIERQDSAAPYHDWNERITEECYGPNAWARVLDGKGRIDRLVNNYARMSFNVGPTLLAWLEEANRPVYEAILAADALAFERTGAGAAIAQAHGHLILPLCNARDRRTQVKWGARDFEVRFGRRPRGMWLPETACDTPSLEALVDEGIEFTILAPSQAARVRPLSAAGASSAPWADVRGGRVETRRAYRVTLPSGRSIVVFFYDGPTSRAVAFERLLDNGEGFANRLASLFHPTAREPQLVHIATDGETYGHHHRFGEMGLAFALDRLESQGLRVSSYEAFLRAHPPTWEAEIVERTSWSCAHGIERWRSHCGCSSGAHGSWSQAWRTPLRDALDQLRDRMAEHFDREGRALFHDPWRARDAYVDVLLEPGEATRTRFLDEHVREDVKAHSFSLIDASEPAWRARALALLEQQRHAMSMYTSCGWFFDDLSGIETTQVLAYALRVIELGRLLFRDDAELDFLATLASGRSNLPEQGDGRAVWAKHVLPRSVSLDRAAAHFAVASLFNDYGDDESRLGFEVHFEHREQRSAGRARLGLGIVTVRRRATCERERFDYAVMHFGDHQLGVGVRPCSSGAPGTCAERPDEARASMRSDLTKAFDEADLPMILRALDRHFPGATYSLRSLFRDEQKRILDEVLATTLGNVEQAYASIYEQQAPLMRYLAGLGQPVPRVFLQAAEQTLAARIRSALHREEDLDLVALDALVNEAREIGLGNGQSPLADPALARAARSALLRLVRGADVDPSTDGITRARDFARFVRRAGLPLEHDSAQQEAVFVRDRFRRRGGSPAWKRALDELLDALGVVPT